MDHKSKVLFVAMQLKDAAFEWFEPTLSDYLEEAEPAEETLSVFRNFA